MSKRFRNTKRKRIRKIFVLLFLSFALFLTTRIGLGSVNVTKIGEYQELQKRIRELQQERETLQIEVQDLSALERIKTIVEDFDLQRNDDNVINVNN